MITYAIITTLALIITLAIARAQFQRCAAQARMIAALTKGIQLEREAVKLANERADTLTLGLRQAQAWVGIYKEHVGQLEDENKMLYRILRKCELLVILSFPKLELPRSVAELGKRDIGLN